MTDIRAIKLTTWTSPTWRLDLAHDGRIANVYHHSSSITATRASRSSANGVVVYDHIPVSTISSTRRRTESPETGA
jgi:hypothetical protein